jgi:hypothetical protein
MRHAGESGARCRTAALSLPRNGTTPLQKGVLAESERERERERDDSRERGGGSLRWPDYG